ncbi:Dynein heavy chain 1, axonemal [Phytophthora cactorum]|uniref:Dynein heavy chain 1, axonemal n=1 Tax=Phytophthora cactorum TaxID=29920 RepID=A0A8T1IQU1_9STRA|nr:Dynein heavy chain 1, axonemal [Phytophthora cactorum]
MDVNSTRLAWRTTPDLCLNDESLVDIITGLRSQVQALEKNELLSGAALPAWLIKALSDVASNVDAVVECQALKDQVASLQKEILDLRHEMLLNVSSSGPGAASAAYNPTPHHRQSTGRPRAQQQATSSPTRALMSTPSSKDLADTFATSGATAGLLQQATGSNGVSAQFVEAMIKPLWDFVHRQTNDFSALKQAFQEAKDTVARLQSEIKRRDAVIKARNEKHEAVVQSQMDKLNENLRSCVTRNDLINAEQRIGQQMKIDRQRMLDEVDARSNKILEDMLTARSDQEDINSSNAEMVELLTRKQGRTEEVIVEWGMKQDSIEHRLEGVKTSLMETTTNLEVNTAAVSALEEKATGFEETQKIVDYLSDEVIKAFKAHEELKIYMENRLVEKIAENVALVRGEVAAVQTVVNDLVNLDLDNEIKAVAAKIDAVALSATDSVRKIAAIQKQIIATDDHNKMQFSQAFDSIDRIQQSLSTLSEESIHLSYTLQRTIESAEKLTSEVSAYKEVTDSSISTLQTSTVIQRSDHEKLSQSMDNELALVKNQLFHFEEVTSAHKREIEDTQRDVDRNFRNQYHENQAIKGSLDSLHTAKDEIMARQDAAESQMMALQAENRAEIQAATAKLVAIVDKESDRVEALYASFQQKQEYFADVVARSSIRNMDLADMNREIDRVCENFVSECWKFETSARSSSKHKADNNGAGRKQFNERQQQLLVRDCQFIADVIVARAEYEILQTGCNKDARSQQTMDEDMLEQQLSIMEKIRVKIHTKIMNNKNIGEQFDKSTLDRRELYIDTINNMMVASMKRRTLMAGGDSNRHKRNSVHDDTVSSTGAGEFLETTRLVGLSSASKGVARRKSVRGSMSVTAPGLSEEAPTSRSAFTPNSNYVLRAGFRLPKASTPSSPATPFHKDSFTTPLSSRSAFDLVNESTEGGSVLLSSPSETSRLKSPETPVENLQGWTTDDEGTMTKSYSLPVAALETQRPFTVQSRSKGFQTMADNHRANGNGVRLAPSTSPSKDAARVPIGIVNFEPTVAPAGSPNSPTRRPVIKDSSHISSPASFVQLPTGFSVGGGHVIATVDPAEREDGEVEPKVFVPYERVPDLPPRKVEVERKKRLYESIDVGTLLKARMDQFYSSNVYQKFEMDNSGTAKMVLDSLELYLFDDESYEIHEPLEWIRLGRRRNGNVRIPVTAASYNVRGVVTAWLEAYVVGYNAETGLFSVEFQRNDKTETKDCRRLDVCFKAEDPNNFADRYVAAQLARVQAQNLLRKNFYIDCMPVEELHKLGNASLGKIVRLATAVFHGKSLRIPDTTRIVHEIQLNYLRTMCRIVFESHQEMGRNADIFRGFLTKQEEVPADPCPRVVVPFTSKSKRTIAPPVDYADQFIGFSFQTFLTSPEALAALIKVNEECYRILQLELFSVKPGRSVKLEEFQQRQQALERAVLKTITEEWPVKVASIIKTSLGNVGKGWYYLQETRQDTYEFSKLRSLLRRVNFSMKDSLRFLTDHSLHQFHDFIKNATVGDVHIVDAKTAFVAYPDLNRHKLGDIKWQHMCLERQLLTPTSLFTVNLSVSTELYVINQREVDAAAQLHASWRPKDPEDTSEENPHRLIEPKMGHIFSFSTNIATFKTAVLDIFMKMLDNLKNIKQVEQMVMSKLFWSSLPCLSCVSANEDWVITLRESIDALIDKAAIPLRAYLQRYEIYIPFINVKEEEYLAEFQAQQPPNLSMIQEAIKKHYQEANTVEDLIPTTNVELGMYSVNCMSIRTLLAEKHRRLAKKLLDLQLKNSTGLAKELLEKFEMVNRQLQKTPQNIEELTEMNAYLEGVPAQIAPLMTQSQQLVKYRLVLDYFQYPYDRDDFMTIWKVRLCPNKINDQMKRMTHMLQMQKTQFSTEMNEQQAEFAETLRILHGEVDGFRQYTDIARLDQVYKYVVNIEQKIAKADEDSKLFNSREVLFGQELTDYDEIQKIRRDFEPYSLLWKTANNWLREHKKWMEGAFLDINGEEIETFVEANWASIQKALKQFEKLNVKGCSSIAAMIKDNIAEFRPHVPLILSMRNPGMQDRHWSQINQEIGMTFRPDRSMKLSYVLDLGLEQHIDAISRIGETAGKEYQIEKTLNSMEEQWSGVNLTIVDYRETETFVLKGVDEIQALLDEQITTTQAMQFSAFKKPFEERINRWERTLSTVSDVLDEWIQVQRSWLYLQPIFDSPDINKQLPTEGKRFATVDKNWRQTLAAAKQKPSTITFCNNDKLLDRFQESNRFLEQVQKGLSDFLETKRSAFSRFYFLSNEELLSILSESKDVKLVQPHLKKCFEGIVSVEFQEDLTITAMISAEGEKVAMTKPVNPVGKNVEHWMTEVEDMMRVSIRDVMYQAIQDYTKISRTKWIQKWPGMCVLNGSQFHWTREMEEEMAASGSDGVQRMMERQLAQLADMVQMVRGHLDKLARVSVGALAVIDVHARDVTMRLVNNKVSSKDDFMWSSQLRYYWEDDLWADMVSARRPYGYEYLGNSFRLVITPLTDKCYMTLMAALQMTLGGAPAGPAGTGKTETTKDLAKALAKQCVVFNCSDGLDYIAMGKFFKGLAACGAWACFDEFNRINIEVLSVIGQQVTTLQLAIRAGDKRIMFEGSDIAVNPQFGVFITMNPGYAGRSDLPDSLAALFRPVAMMVPDYAMIGEIMFFAYGYEKAKQCGAKMVTTFKLCSEMLSSQSHYDYGMRAVKTVITAAGNYKRSDPDMDEEVLLLRALQDVNLPKFLAHDIPLFGGIISDLFPEKQHLQVHPFFLMKVIQLYETLCVRHGLMVVGSTGGGKSANLNVLADALTELKQLGEIGHAYEKVLRYQLNPKSITMGQLYGEFDANTHEWQDGVLSTLYREAASDTKPDRKWVIFDGPVDAIWIENMNTVLDDNKKLCLASGEIIQMSNEMTMMFEVEDLSVASPATVSRTGMVYMEPSSLGFDPLVTSWLEKVVRDIGLGSVPPVVQLCLQLHLLLDVYLRPALQFVTSYVKEWLPQIPSNLVQSLLRLLDCFFFPMQGDEKKEAKLERVGFYLKNTESFFLFSLIWSVGATGNDAGRDRFDAYLRQEMIGNNVKKPLPAAGQVYDYSFDLAKENWVPWLQTIPTFAIDSSASFSELVVPTADSVRSTFLMSLTLPLGVHMLIVGPTGTGKTINVNQFLEKSNPDKYIPLSMAFSAQSSANQTQDFIDSKMEKRRKGVFGPTAGKKFIIYVDDLNMPKQEEYFAQPPIEILRQWFDQGGWYDRKLLTFRTIIDVVFVCSMGPPGGGRNPITQRFVRHFNIVGYTEMSNESKAIVFETIVGNFFSRFSEEIRPPQIAKKLVQASIVIYNTVIAELLPTPAKSHYTFNLRDLAKVFQGVLMGDSKRITKLEQMLRLWVHENMRVFKDRFTTPSDHQWFIELLQTQVATVFGDSLGISGASTDSRKAAWDLVHPTPTLFYGDYMVPGADPKVYEEISDVEKLQAQVEEYLNDYNAESSAPMNLVLFMNAIEHVSRIARVIRQPQGNALLLGVGGSGRQSLTRLAAYMAEYSCTQIEISKGYGVAEWRDDLKKCLMKAGIDEKPLVFLFSDVQIVHEAMLEDINNVLNSGDVPNLYAPEDLDQISQHCRAYCVKKKIPPTKLNTFAQYILLVRQNLHLVLCMSPLGSLFRDRIRMFPSLVNCCTIDWFSEWPAEALQSVAASALSSGDFQLSGEPATSGEEESAEAKAAKAAASRAVVSLFQTIHQSVERESVEFFEKLRRYNYVTPTSYLELLHTFKTVLLLKREEVQSKRSRLQNGVDKIIATKEQVAGMQEQLVALKPQLEKTQIEVEEMMKQITLDKKDADETKAIVEKEEQIANKKAAETKEIADDAQRDLDEALPALEAAVQCLNRLKKSDIDEVKALKNPPHGVKLTMEAACIIFGIKPTMKADPDKAGQKVKDYWESAQKTILGNAKKLMEDMLKFDKDNIGDKIIQELDRYIEMEEFSPAAVRKASVACEAICMWVRAMHTYHNVAKMVEPKKVVLATAQAELDVTMRVLADAKARLQAVVERLAELERNYNNAVDKKDQLVRDVRQCEIRLESALKLIGLLGGEETRWAATIRQLNFDYTNLVGDVIISAATISYLGTFTSEFREACVSTWYAALEELKLPHTKGCNIITTLADPVKVRGWQIAGLPSDNLSVQNGLIMARARRWSLLIDPQGQANRFIKNLGKDSSENGLDVVKLTDKGFLKTLENGIRFGKWILLENVGESLDATLEPVLLQNKFRQGGQVVMKLGDSTVPYNPAFRFYMTTKLPNPHYPPETSVKVTLLNFTITPKGLEDQALGVVVQEEMPELAEKKNSLVVANARMKAELVEIENKILYMLANSKGNILDDTELIDTLGKAKVTSEDINEKMAEAEITEKAIDESRERYRGVAFRSSLLFFCIADLALVDPMYQYSLPWFVSLFIKSIHSATESDQLEMRLAHLNDSATYSLYRNICRSLFEEHKLLFSFLLTIKLLMGSRKIDMLEWRFLISGSTSSSIEAPNPDTTWIEDRMWREVCALSSLSAFETLTSSMATNTSQWRKIFDSADPQVERLPLALDLSLNSFQKLCVLRCIRPDRMTEAMQNFVAEHIGRRFIEPPPFDLAGSFADSTVITPIIFVLSTGSDPAKELLVFAETMKMNRKLNSISLGQGQGPLATKMIEEAVTSGKWVLLQNCHLAISWMPQLERICDELNPDATHRDFRLWLTSKPSTAFPTSVLQNGVKMTKEPPKGIRANLRNSYIKLTNDTLDATSKPDQLRKLLFGLSFFHAVVIERKRFGPLGWNIPYAFNDTDYDISRAQLEMFLDFYDEVPYKVLCVMTSVINYGGRVTDDKDMRTIDVILEGFFNAQILEDGYKFSSSGSYYSLTADPDDPLASYLSYIDDLPLNPEPEVFGMHDNANITCALAETFHTFDIILALQPRAAAGAGGQSRESLIEQQAQSIMDRLPPLFEVEHISLRYPVMYEESMNTVLVQEVQRYNALLRILQVSLPSLQRALRGLIVMSPQLEAMATCLFNQKVPPQWEKKAYPSLKALGGWVDDLLERLQFLTKWVDNGIPPVFWLSGFFFPQGFLTGILQNHARQFGLAIDSLSFDFLMQNQIADNIKTKPEKGGCYMTGLFLEGARWDRISHSLVDPLPKELFARMPVVHLLPIQDRQAPQSGIYRCPVYKILTRTGTLSTTGHSTNFVFWIEIPSDKRTIFRNSLVSETNLQLQFADQDYWIKAGVACFLSLMY